MSENKFSLVLGCGGKKHLDFILCSGTLNQLINFDKHIENNKAEEIMVFLDYTCGLFDAVMWDWNKVINTIKILRDKYSLIDDNMWENLHIWLPQHKKCGGFLRIILNTELFMNEKDDFVLPESKVTH